jgi:hypothetical protein
MPFWYDTCQNWCSTEPSNVPLVFSCAGRHRLQHQDIRLQTREIHLVSAFLLFLEKGGRKGGEMGEGKWGTGCGGQGSKMGGKGITG